MIDNQPKWTQSILGETQLFMAQNTRGGIRALAKHLGVSRQTIYNWQKAHPMFRALWAV